MRNAGLEEAQAGIKIARRNINNLRYANNTTLMAESEEELKSLLMKKRSEKVGLKLNIQKTKIMASGPITLWQIDGETMETVTDFIFLGSKITADGECSHEIKRRLLLGRKVMTNLDSILKSRDITLPTKVHLIKAMVFPVVMYGCESWTIKKAERQRIDAFELWCWRRLLRVPRTARRSNQSTLKEISPECSLEGLMLKLKLIWKGPDAGKGWRQEEKGTQRMRWLDGITDSMDRVWVNSGSWWWTGKPGMLQSIGLQSQTTLSNWTELIKGYWLVDVEGKAWLEITGLQASVFRLTQWSSVDANWGRSLYDVKMSSCGLYTTAKCPWTVQQLSIYNLNQVIQ